MPTKRRYLSPKEQLTVIERQGRRCACGCRELLEATGTKFDHDTPLWTGEDTPEDYKRLNDIGNFRALKNRHHLEKTHVEATQRAKEARVRAKNDGTWLNARDRMLASLMARTKQLAE